MGSETGIAWTGCTFNIVWGCVKVSEACKFCYAETWSKRMGLKVWGQDAERRTFGEKHWREPLKWNAAAAKAGIRKRVFCSSMADVFEDHPTVAEERKKLWPLIEQTPWLDWQLLTKRPENMVKFAPESWRKAWPKNVWAGTTAENQERADERIHDLLRTPAAIRFVSYEPALGPVDFRRWFTPTDPRDPDEPSVDWIIVGGESGSHARPFDMGWARSVVAQCKAAGVACFVKQMGEDPIDGLAGCSVQFRDRKGGDPAEWPEELRIQQFPEVCQ